MALSDQSLNFSISIDTTKASGLKVVTEGLKALDASAKATVKDLDSATAAVERFNVAATKLKGSRSPLPYGSSGYGPLNIGGVPGSMAAIADLMESTVRGASMQRFGSVSRELAVGASRLRGREGLSLAKGTQQFLGATEGLQSLYLRRDLGEKVQTSEIRAMQAQLEATTKAMEGSIKGIMDPSARLAAKMYLRDLKTQVLDLHANAELSGTIFDPRHWGALARNAGPVMRNVFGWLAHNPSGRTALGVAGIAYGIHGMYKATGGLESAMTAHAMTGDILRSSPGMSRDTALGVMSDALGRTSGVITRADMLRGLGAASQAGLSMDIRPGAAEYLSYAQRGFGLDSRQGAGLLGEMSNRFSATLANATIAIGQFAGEATRSRVSIGELGMVAARAAGAASEADYRLGTGVGRMTGGVTAFSAATRFFGGGAAGGMLAAPLTDLSLRLQRGEMGAIQGGSMLFGPGAIGGLMGRTGSVDMLRGLNYGLLRSLVGQPPMVLNAMAQEMGIPYETLAALVGRVGKGETISARDLAGAPSIDARLAAKQTTAALERFRQGGASWIDELTSWLPDTAINSAHGTGLVGFGLDVAKYGIAAWGGTKMAGVSLGKYMPWNWGRGAAAAAASSAASAASLPVWNAATRTWVPAAASAGVLSSTAGALTTGVGALGWGTLLGAGSLAAAPGAILGTASVMEMAGREGRAQSYLGLSGVDLLRSIGQQEGGLGAGWNDMVTWGGAAQSRATYRDSLKLHSSAAIRSVMETSIRDKALRLNLDPAEFLKQDVNKRLIEGAVTDYQTRMAGVDSITKIASENAKTAEKLDAFRISQEDVGQAGVDWLEKIHNVLLLRVGSL